MYHSSLQKPKLKNRKVISEVGCEWFHDNEENPSERVINIVLNDAVQILTFYWPDNEERRPIPLENIIMPYEQIPHVEWYSVSVCPHIVLNVLNYASQLQQVEIGS